VSKVSVYSFAGQAIGVSEAIKYRSAY